MKRIFTLIILISSFSVNAFVSFDNVLRNGSVHKLKTVADKKEGECNNYLNHSHTIIIFLKN